MLTKMRLMSVPLACALCAFSPCQDTGPAALLQSRAIEGLVTYDGPPLDPVPIPEAGTVRHLIEVDAKTKGLKDAVVWLEGVPALERPADDTDANPAVQIDQQNYVFVPHVVAVEAGLEVEFLNSDNANHGVRATPFEPKNTFNVTTPPGKSFKRRFVATKRPVAIGCPIHASMAAWVFVFEHPYHAVTEEDGSFHLPPVPPGRDTFHVRHQDGGMSKEQELVVAADKPVRLRLTFSKDDMKAGARKRSGSDFSGR
jgi:plastocyanin